MSVRPQSQAMAGFTLVELLVVLALTSLLVLGLYQAFRIGSRAADRANPDTDAAVQFALIQDFLDRDVAAALPLPDASDAAQDIQFEGEPKALSFVSLPPAFLGFGGLGLLHVRLVEGRIEVSWEPLARGFSDAVPPVRPSILMEGVRTIAFAYFGIPTPNEAPGWTERWAGRTNLPKLVRLRIILANGTRSPDMIVAPRLGNN